MNLQLHHVVSDITGVTGMRIILAHVGQPPAETYFNRIETDQQAQRVA